MDLQIIEQILQSECGLEPGALIVVGFSGGPDSMSLLDVLHHSCYSIVAAHLDHGLRPESIEDAQQASDYCVSRNIPFVTERQDVAGLAVSNKMSIEEAARTARYQFLFAQARCYHAAAVAVAHTADDQVETVLMHLIRGAGLTGLQGMAYRSTNPVWDEQLPIIRPLLCIWREEVVAYCSKNGLEAVTDSSNFDTTFFRNRLRHHLIPELQDYNPKIKQIVWRMSRSLEGDNEIIQDVLEDAWKKCLVEEGRGYFTFSISELKQCLTGTRRNLFRSAIGKLVHAERDISFEVIERALIFLEEPSRSGRIDLIAGLVLLLEGDSLHIMLSGADLNAAARFPQIPAGKVYNLEPDGEIGLSNGWFIKAESIGASLEAVRKPTGDSYQACLDCANLDLPFLIRAREPGDRIQPLGLGGKSIKLSDLLVNVKLPRRLRAAWPIVTVGEQIVWVPGYHTADSVKVEETTQQAVRLHLYHQAALD
jgi:tRNA(Ile)-lysidine synthase